MSSADIPPVPASILKKKSNIIRAIDTTSRHTIETQDNNGGNVTTSIVKRKTPSTQALVTVPVLPEKRFDYTGKVYEHENRIAEEGEHRAGWNKYERDHPDDIAKMDHENYQADTLAKYEFNHHPDRAELDEKMHYNIKNRKKIKKANKEFDWKKGKKSAFPEGTPIYDANYREMNGEILDEKEPEPRLVSDGFRIEKSTGKKASKKIKVTSGRKEEPASIQAINIQKRKVKSELLKPSQKFRNNNRNGDDWLIDAAFDQVVGAGKAIGKAAKATGKVAGIAVKEGFHATKKGIQGFNEISEEVVKNPMLVRMGQVHEANMRGMASHRRNALGSIAATGTNRRQLTAGSLVKQHGLVSHNNATITPQITNRLRVVTKIVHRGNRDEVVYFRENGRQITRNQARLIQEGILPPALSNNASSTIEQANNTFDAGTITKKPVSVSGLVTRHHGGLGSNQNVGNPVLNKTKIASPSGLVTRNNIGLGTNQSIANPVGDSEHNPIGEITKVTTASGLVTRNRRGLGSNQRSGNPVLNVAKIASPSRLMRSTHSGVV
jgi:hypothetical protein